MSTIKNQTVEKGNADRLSDEGQHDIRQREFYQGRCRIPRRYVVAIILCPILVLQIWFTMNISSTLYQAAGFPDGPIQNHTIEKWTPNEVKKLAYVNLLVEIVAQIPGTLLIYLLSSHKFLPASVAASSLLHMLIPLALQYHSYALVGVLISQWVIIAPLKVAVVSVWKNWSPPGERTRLLAITFFGLLLCYPYSPLIAAMWMSCGHAESFYISGCCGLIWSLLWYVLTSDSPSNDMGITENEYLYLQNTIPSTVKETSKISEIPWRSILISKPVLALSLAHYKTSFSLMIVMNATYYFVRVLPFKQIMITSYVVIIPFTVVLTDVLIRKLIGRTTLIRKCFFCGASIVQAFLLLGMISRSYSTQTIFFHFSYIILVVSFPGYITIALDLSPRYVSIVAALCYMCELLGIVTYLLISKYLYTYWKDDPYGMCFLLDCILSILAAGIFRYWGSAEEQLWSMRSASCRRSRDFLSFPKPEDKDDTNLVSDNI